MKKLSYSLICSLAFCSLPTLAKTRLAQNIEKLRDETREERHKVEEGAKKVGEGVSQAAGGVADAANEAGTAVKEKFESQLSKGNADDKLEPDYVFVKDFGQQSLAGDYGIEFTKDWADLRAERLRINPKSVVELKTEKEGKDAYRVDMRIDVFAKHNKGAISFPIKYYGRIDFILEGGVIVDVQSSMEVGKGQELALRHYGYETNKEKDLAIRADLNGKIYNFLMDPAHPERTKNIRDELKEAIHQRLEQNKTQSPAPQQPQPQAQPQPQPEAAPQALPEPQKAPPVENADGIIRA